MLSSVTLEAPAATSLYDALGVGEHVRMRESDSPTTGFRGFTLSLVVPQPNIVDAYLAAALDAGGSLVKPAKRSFWGYGGVFAAPDGALWKIATSKRRDTGPASLRFDDVVLLLGVVDIKASKEFYADHGLAPTKTFGRKYAEYSAPDAPVTLALLRRSALAKDAGADPEGSGSHRIALHSAAGAFTDLDGFAWEPTS